MASVKIHKKHHKHLNNPFPSTPKTLPFVEGTLLFNSETIPHHLTHSIGNDFQLGWSSNNGGYLSISHNSNSDQPIWSTVPGQAFVSAASVDTQVEESRGSFAFNDTRVRLVSDRQTIQEIRMVSSSDDCDCFDLEGVQFPAVVVTGSVFNKKKRVQSCFARYWILFDEKTSNQVGFKLMLETPAFERRPVRGLDNWCWSRSIGGSSDDDDDDEVVERRRLNEVSKCLELNRLCLSYSSEENERFYGFGEQFSHMDFKGKRVPIFVQEQGIGRGDQPITFAANLVSYRAGGDWSTTYAPSPFYMTSKMRSLYLQGYDYSVFDLTRHDKVQIQIHGNSVQGRILYGNSPTELIEHYTEVIGRPPELPNWIISGAVVGMQGGTDNVRRIWDALKIHKVPVSAFWLQDWVGQRETIIGSQLWWNWEVDTDRYSGWEQLLRDLKDQHIQVMTYCNPCLAPTDKKPNRRRNLFEEAKKLDILVKDKNGDPYMVANTAFDVGMLDLTHPNTAKWYKQVLQKMVDTGVRGWMADFGEGLPMDVTLYSGEDPISAHNRYPELWAQINREFVDEWKGNRAGKEKEDSEEALVFFMRAGFRDSPKWGMLFWEGDQMVSWQTNDGIKSSVVGLLSSGLSGYAFNHSDIGGYCAVNLPLIKYRRSEELLLRWMELNAFTAVFRTHEGNKPSVNSQFYSNERTLSHFARFAKVYKAWKFYRVQLVKEAAQRGLPICRHLFLHYPDDERIQRMNHDQFLVGTEILVVPVLDKGKKKVRAYFPVSEINAWQHIWTGKLFTRQDSDVWIDAPIGYPAVFVKTGSIVGDSFLQNLRNSKVL